MGTSRRGSHFPALLSITPVCFRSVFLSHHLHLHSPNQSYSDNKLEKYIFNLKNNTKNLRKTQVYYECFRHSSHTQTERSRPRLLDRLLLNSYHPPRGPVPPMEEVLAPEPDGAQEIIDYWRPFNRGESPVDHLHDLYLALLRMPIIVWVEGRGEEYAILAPTSIDKEDLLQMVEDGMLVRNCNFSQSTELVRL